MDLTFNLTLRNLYSLITGKLNDISSECFLYKDNLPGLTLTRFWREFFQLSVDDSILDSFFNTEQRRPRSLSVLMNRSEFHSCPKVIFDALERSLSTDQVLKMTVWWQEKLDRTIHSWHLSEALNIFEQVCEQNDFYFAQLNSFFQFYREQFPKDAGFYDREHFGCALRLTWLSLHAIYGNQMREAPQLFNLRHAQDIHPDELWRRAYTAYRHEPAQAASYVAPTLPSTEGTTEQNADDAHPYEPAAQRINTIKETTEKLLLSLEQQAIGDHHGWYVVANWSDPHIAMNDQPCATYNGSTLLTCIPNGELLWVESANGYNGLHNSSGCWGLTHYGDMSGYVPMTFLVKIVFTENLSEE